MRTKIMAVLMFALLTCAAFAQQTSKIRGTVKDAQGKPIEGAQILLQGQRDDGPVKYTLKTNKKGEFFSIAVRQGPYAMSVIKDGNTIYAQRIEVVFQDEKNQFDVVAGGGAASQPAETAGEQQQPGAAPAPAPAGEQTAEQKGGPIDLCAPTTVLTEEQMKKLSPEQKETYENCRKAHAANAQIKNINNVLKQAAAADEAGNPDQAAQILQPVTQNNANFALPWVLLGNYEAKSAKKMTDATQKKQQFEKAAADMQKGIQLAESGADPKVKAQVPNWRLNYGTVLESARMHDEAIKVFEQVAQEAAADPKAAALANYNAGVAATNAGKSDQAVQYFDKAISTDPTLADAYYQKGVALMGKATTDKAGKFIAPPGTEEAFEKYLDLAPTGPNADAAKSMLDSMGSKVATKYKKSK